MILLIYHFFYGIIYKKLSIEILKGLIYDFEG